MPQCHFLLKLVVWPPGPFEAKYDLYKEIFFAQTGFALISVSLPTAFSFYFVSLQCSSVVDPKWFIPDPVQL